MSEAQLPSEILVQRAQRRDTVAIEALYTRYRSRLERALARRLGANLASAGCESEDVLQDAMLAALEKLEGFRYRGEGSFLAWLLRIAENELCTRLRAGARLKRSAAREATTVSQVDLCSPDPSPSQVAVGNEAEERVRRALAQLPQREQEVIVLRRYLELDAAQIAEALALPSPGAARAVLSRAQARLAQVLDAAAEE